MCDNTHTYVWHGVCICVSWLIHMCFMTESCMWNKSYTCVTRLVSFAKEPYKRYHILQKRPIILRSLLIVATPYVKWHIHMCNMTRFFVRHDSSVCMTWLMHMCVMTHPCVLYDSIISVKRLIQMWWKTRFFVRHDSFLCMTWLIHMCVLTYQYVLSDSIMYGVATISRLLKFIGLFCKRAL